MFGVAFSNLLQDVLFHIDEYMRLLYTGNFFQLLNPFGLLASIVSLTMLVTQGATYPTGEIYLRLRMAAHIATLMMELCFLLADICLMKGIDGYVVTSALDTMAESNPLRKAVAHQADAWLINFNTYPLLWALPVLGIISATAVYRTVLTFGKRGSGIYQLVTDHYLCDPHHRGHYVPVRDAFKHST